MRTPLLLTGLLLAHLAQASLSVNFDSPTSIADNFAGNGMTLPAWGAASGLAGSGAIDIGTADYGSFGGVAQSGGESFATVGGQLSAAMYFRFDLALNSNVAGVGFNNPDDARLLDLLIAENPAVSLTSSSAGHAHSGIRLSTVKLTSTPYANAFRFAVRNNNATPTSSASNFVLTPGNWYRFAVTFTNQNDLVAGQVGLNAVIEDWGATGASLVGTMANENFTASNAVLTADAEVFFGMRVPRGDNLAAADNLSFSAVVPEPGHAALAGALAALALGAWRRRPTR